MIGESALSAPATLREILAHGISTNGVVGDAVDAMTEEN
jgi:hypothetical protein